MNGTAKSAIDYFILCEEMFSYLSTMQIDEARLHVLAKYAKVKGNVVITQSDHNPIISTFNCLWNDLTIQEKQRFEIFNYKDKEGLI